MRSSIALFALAATPISAFNLNLWPRADACPPIWKDVAADLKKVFNGCGVEARSAIRAVFHDGMAKAADGSLVLTDECTTRPENKGLAPYCSQVKQWSHNYGVSAADMIQFAGAMAISSCTRGPRVQALVGRKDSYTANPPGNIPSSRDPVEKILAMFKAKNFTPIDVVALVGAHTVARQNFDDPKQAGKSLDNSPDVYDIRFYSDTKFQTAPYSLKSDLLMSNATETKGTWAIYTKSTAMWSDAFVSAWNRFAVVGVESTENLKDCSDLIPPSNLRRDELAANEGSAETLRKKFVA